MNNVTVFPKNPFYLRVKIRVARVGHFNVDGFVFFGPFRTEASAREWYQGLYETLETTREYGSIVLEISLEGFTLEHNLTKVYYLHNVQHESIEESANLLPNILLRETHLAYQFLSGARNIHQPKND